MEEEYILEIRRGQTVLIKEIAGWGPVYNEKVLVNSELQWRS
jgi:hypothetical protein